MSAADVEQASLYDEVSADHLAPNEPRPGAPLGRIESLIDRSLAGNGGRNSRDDKNRRDDRSQQPDSNSPTPEPEPSSPHAHKHVRKMSRGVVAAGSAFAIVVLAAGVAMASRGDDPPSTASTPTTTVAGAPGPSTNSRPGPATPSTTRVTRSTLPVRFAFTETTISAQYGSTRGTCDNGVTPGKVMMWTSPSETTITDSRAYVDPPPPGVTAFEMTWVGADRYEVQFPKGAVEIGRTGQEVVADCSGATTRKSGKSLEGYSIGHDIENVPITDQPFVIIRGEFDPRFNDCPSPAQPVDVKVQWGIAGDDYENDPSTIFAEEPMQLGPDGVYRVSIETSRYLELMKVGHYETSHYRCDWGNG